MFGFRFISVLIGRNPRVFFKEHKKLWYVIKAAFVRDIRYRECGMLQKLFRVIDLFIQNIFFRRFSRFFFEENAKIIGRISRNGGKLVYIQFGTEILVDITQGKIDGKFSAIGGSKLRLKWYSRISR